MLLLRLLELILILILRLESYVSVKSLTIKLKHHIPLLSLPTMVSLRVNKIFK